MNDRQFARLLSGFHSTRVLRHAKVAIFGNVSVLLFLRLVRQNCCCFRFFDNAILLLLQQTQVVLYWQIKIVILDDFFFVIC